MGSRSQATRQSLLPRLPSRSTPRAEGGAVGRLAWSWHRCPAHYRWSSPSSLPWPVREGDSVTYRLIGQPARPYHLDLERSPHVPFEYLLYVGLRPSCTLGSDLLLFEGLPPRKWSTALPSSASSRTRPSRSGTTCNAASTMVTVGKNFRAHTRSESPSLVGGATLRCKRSSSVAAASAAGEPTGDVMVEVVGAGMKHPVCSLMCGDCGGCAAPSPSLFIEDIGRLVQGLVV